MSRWPTELPWDDPAVDRLDAPSRALLAASWERRARSELRVAHAFTTLAAELADAQASPIVLDLLATSIDDERRHSEVCRRLASRYAGHEIAAPVAGAVDLPRFEGAGELRPSLLVLGMCCINETIATVWLHACLTRARTQLARAAHRMHFLDEMNHARVGWAHLASAQVSDTARRALGGWVVRLLRANVPSWFDPAASLPGDALPDHGALSLAETRTVVTAAVRETVLPGLAALGIKTPPPDQ